MSIQRNRNNREDTRSFIAPSRQISHHAPLNWLKLGWEDFKRIPRLSFVYGLVMALIALGIVIVSWQAYSFVLAIAMVAGFFFIGPSLAIGLYSMSCQLQNGITPQFMRCVREGRKNMANELVLSFVFLIVFLIWARAAAMVHVFLPNLAEAGAADIMGFLLVGSAIGAIFAAVVFCIGAFSIPMMMDRDVDAVTAIISSVSAVLRNKLVMLIWGMLIVLGILAGMAAGFIGLAITLPVIGHATWHAYQEVIDIAAWEAQAHTRAE